MFHVGLDIHSTRISICVLNETGQVFHRFQVRGIEEMLRVLKGLPRSLRGLLRSELWLRPLPRPVASHCVAGAHSAPGSIAFDLSVEEQERPQ
jgi:hypothetical protein